ncbi:CIA30 family protein [Pleionea sp. CnH1-48]|uniref:CIA30 family protein n=1 Tax=Pleionea sp. CnH1-48 TaxID=2954494 RepID=UPI002097263F|nr:CIA30 family protein [Pleionea sp. CnH1-48]MCO7223277.1 CIA30 family protein [Pleionea sp. CnH1-48]
MKPTSLINQALSLAALLAFSGVSLAGSLNSVIDDFSDAKNNSFGIARHYINDTVAGGNTTTQQAVSKGIMSVKGKIVPARGQPGWASTVLPLAAEGQPLDASDYEGIRLLVRVNSGNINISANSTKITNFDYHAAPVVVASDGQFHEVKIPFKSMKRAWSEQTQLDTKTINSLSIVAYSPQRASFEFEVDEVSFY